MFTLFKYNKHKQLEEESDGKLDCKENNIRVVGSHQN